MSDDEMMSSYKVISSHNKLPSDEEIKIYNTKQYPELCSVIDWYKISNKDACLIKNAVLKYLDLLTPENAIDPAKLIRQKNTFWRKKRKTGKKLDSRASESSAKNAKKPADQLAVANATISELNERERRKKNVIIYGIPESEMEFLTDKKADDSKIIKEIFNEIGKSSVSPVYARRLKFKDTIKPGPIIVELSDVSLRNPLLLAAKHLREKEGYKSICISPDLTEAQRSLDYDLRKKRNEANSTLAEYSPFRYGIRDFNFPSIVWSNGYITNIKNGIEHNFSETFTRIYLYQHVNVPTFKMSNNSATNTLDLILITQSGSVRDPRSVLGNINKGHLVIFFDFIIKSMVNNLSHSYLKFNYKKNDTNKTSDFITNIDWVMLLETLSVQEMYDNLTHFLNVSCNQFIPVLDVSRIKKQIAPWIKNDLKTLIKKKHNLRYLNCACKCQQLIKESIRALKTANGGLTQEPREIANLLNKYFQDVFVIEEEGELPHFTVELNENHSKFVDLDPNDISYKMVLDKLKNLNQNKACGPDNMHPFLLINCAEAFAIPLTLIIRASLTNSQLPVQFKSANVTPLFKKGDKTLPSNYRPVSLTSIPCKIMEKSIDYISSSLDVGIPVDVILLDFAKAFDTVPHKRLLAKLKAYGFDGLILKWIKAFLENRRQRVVQCEIISDLVNIFSGVPQESVIAALLFALYINNLPKKLHNVTKLYANDTKVLSQLSSEQCATNLQNDLDIVYKWSQTWLLLFNILKRVVMHYGHNNKKYLYNLNSIQLKVSDTERDLGVLFNANLKWKNQMSNTSNKTNQMHGRIKKSFACFDYKLLRLLYITFIRPLLEFAVPVWSPYYKSDCDYIEKIQHKATKLVSLIRNLSYTKRLEKLNLTTLGERRQRGDLIQMYKL
ncbi:uncharacterized protein LOC136087036 [Hydra vulgaris]|uniref:Uncharacterized protein LOC136087036 n=1 Tax=Hydra vulgaris TaxID=6087 RepID=A0ABM4CUJ5_HYDVU